VKIARWRRGQDGKWLKYSIIGNPKPLNHQKNKKREDLEKFFTESRKG